MTNREGEEVSSRYQRAAVAPRPHEAVVAAVIFAVTLASRLPFMARHLSAWDSVLYSRALEQGFHVGFDLAEQRPHAPGYVFYVAAAQALRAFVGSSNTALVLVSVIASAGSAALLYLFARRFARRSVALAVAVAFAADPLVWVEGEIALPYALLAMLSIGLAWSLYERPGLLGSIAFGVLGGFRQDLLALLGPLWLWSLRDATWRGRAACALGVAIGSLTWLVPSAALSGGLADYVSTVVRQVGAVSATSSVATLEATALWVRVRFMVLFLAWGLSAMLALAIVAGTDLLHRLRQGIAPPTERQLFFLLWIAPGLAVFVFVHVGDWGQPLSILPGIYVALAAAAEGTMRKLDVSRRPVAALAAAALVLPSLFIFTLTGARFSAAALERSDRSLAQRVAYVQEHFPPSSTAILAWNEFLQVRYYLPGYRAWLYDPARIDPLPDPLPAGVDQVVVFTEGIPLSPPSLHTVDLGNGVRIAYVAVR
ncbi:MAG: hypothetical protein KGJ98_10245 [Chloroflexota bacterium]|nr:hypothetical protein [Chloroflexota bacterium]